MLRDPLRKVATLRIRGCGPKSNPMSCPLPSSSFSHRTNTLRDSLVSFDRGAQISRLATPQSSELDDSTSKLLFIHSTCCLNRTGESSSRPMPSLGSCWCNFGRASDENLETIVSFHCDFVNTAVGLLVPGFPQSWKIAKHDHIKTCGPESSFSSPQPGPLWQLEVVCPHRPPASQPTSITSPESAQRPSYLLTTALWLIVKTHLRVARWPNHDRKRNDQTPFRSSCRCPTPAPVHQVHFHGSPKRGCKRSRSSVQNIERFPY